LIGSGRSALELAGIQSFVGKGLEAADLISNLNTTEPHPAKIRSERHSFRCIPEILTENA
jgi:hypothetical protein